MDKSLLFAIDQLQAEKDVLVDKLKLIQNAHESLLNTLAPSKHYWVVKVYANAKAYYDTIKDKT